MTGSQVPAPSRPTPKWRTRRWQVRLHQIFTAFIVVAVAVIVIGELFSKPEYPGQCEGIGWGCSLYGPDAAAFAAVILVPLGLVVLLIGNAFIAFVGWLWAVDVKHRKARTR